MTREEAVYSLQLSQAQEFLYTIEERLLEQKIYVTRLLLQHYFRTFSKVQEASKAAKAETAHIVKDLQIMDSLPGQLSTYTSGHRTHTRPAIVPHAAPQASPIKPRVNVRAVNGKFCLPLTFSLFILFYTSQLSSQILS